MNTTNACLLTLMAPLFISSGSVLTIGRPNHRFQLQTQDTSSDTQPVAENSSPGMKRGTREKAETTPVAKGSMI
jgi:hypothetical protein